MGQAVDDEFLSRLAMWELAQSNYHTLYRAAEAAGDFGPPEYVDDAADACRHAADIALKTKPTSRDGILAFCRFMQDEYFRENPERLQLGYATLERALDAMIGVEGHTAAIEDDGRGMPRVKLALQN